MPSGDAVTNLKRPLRRPAIAALVLFVVYGGIALWNSNGGYLGTDTGAKVITLEAMVDDDTVRPDVGYWAEEWDPEGALHPLFDTVPNDEGEWINVTTLPMLLLGRPLYALGGYDLALLLPMAGAVGAALVCRSIARRLRDDDTGWLVFWVVGLAGPMTIYAVDFWEHSVGAGLMVGAIALLLRGYEHDRPMLWAAVAGFLFGTSATMRTESLVVAFVSVGVFCSAWLLRRRPLTAVVAGVSAVVGFAPPWLLNAALDRSLGGNSRTRGPVARPAEMSGSKDPNGSEKPS